MWTGLQNHDEIKNPWDEKNPIKEIIMQDNFFENIKTIFPMM